MASLAQTGNSRQWNNDNNKAIAFGCISHWKSTHGFFCLSFAFCVRFFRWIIHPFSVLRCTQSAHNIRFCRCCHRLVIKHFRLRLSLSLLSFSHTLHLSLCHSRILLSLRRVYLPLPALRVWYKYITRISFILLVPILLFHFAWHAYCGAYRALSFFSSFFFISFTFTWNVYTVF